MDGTPTESDRANRSVQAPSRPTVSVVISAHLRTQFLKEAVSSVASQSPDEIIVVKYSADEVLDRELAGLGAKVVLTQEPFQGGKVAVGIEQARGDVVALLDDDDTFLPGKVSRIREVFADPRVVLHTNRFIPFTQLPTGPPELGPSRLFLAGEGNLYKQGLRPVVASCLAVRRRPILPWVNDLHRLTIADHTMFMIAVAHQQPIAVDRSILTGYRVATMGGAVHPAQSIWSRPGATAERDLRWMLDLLDSTTDGVRDTLSPMVASAVIHLVFLTGDANFHDFRRTVRAILGGLGIRRPLVVPTILMLGYPLSPRLAIQLNRRWKSLVGYRLQKS